MKRAKLYFIREKAAKAIRKKMRQMKVEEKNPPKEKEEV
jgi:ribosomal protein L19